MLWNKNICVQEPRVLGSLTCKVLRKQEFPGFGTVVTTRKNDVKCFSSLYSWVTKSEVTSSAPFPSVDPPNEGSAEAAGTVSHCSTVLCGAARRLLQGVTLGWLCPEHSSQLLLFSFIPAWEPLDTDSRSRLDLPSKCQSLGPYGRLEGSSGFLV